MSRAQWSSALAGAGATVGVATPAFAAAAVGDGSLREFAWQVGNLLVLIAVLVYAARKPIQVFFADRRDEIKREIDEASEVLAQAEARHAQWQRKLVDLDRELEEIRTTATQRAEGERDRIIADAHATAERIRAAADAAIDQELRRAKDELAREASTLALELAARMLQERVTQGDRERLVDEFISSVERPPATSGARR